MNNDHGNYVFATFTGHIYDTTLDIYFAEARFYDATNRTWLAMDPIKDDLNWYQYCLSNPTTNWDPTGLYEMKFFMRLEGSGLSTNQSGVVRPGHNSPKPEDVNTFANDRWWKEAGTDEYWYNRAYMAEKEYSNIQSAIKHSLGLFPIVNSVLVAQMGGSHLKTAERVEVYENLFAAWVFYSEDFATQAHDMKVELFIEQYPADSSQAWLEYDGARPNAFQHVYWNALMTYATDSETAAEFATAHEVLSYEEYENGALDSIANEGVEPPNPGVEDNYTLRDHVYMDMHNNEVGQKIGASIPHNAQEVHDLLIDVAYNGDVTQYEVDTATTGVYGKYSDADILLMYYSLQAVNNGDAVWLIE